MRYVRAKKEPSEQPKALRQVFKLSATDREPDWILGINLAKESSRLTFLTDHRHHLAFFDLNKECGLREGSKLDGTQSMFNGYVRTQRRAAIVGG